MKYWSQLPDWLKRAIHTFWQAFLTVFIVGLSPLLTTASNGTLDDTRSALIALVIASISAGLSAIKSYLVERLSDGKLSD